MIFLHHIGIDIGGTKIEAATLDPEGVVLQRRRVATPSTYDGILAAVSSLVDAIRPGGPCTVGAGTPGRTGSDGLIKYSNTRCIMYRPLERDLARVLGVPVLTANDADCFALAEYAMGAAAGHKMVFGIIMGTGVGGGIVVDGRIWGGRVGMAGEWGHSVLYPGGNMCWCGRRGCVETYLSGPAIRERWHHITGTILDIPDILREQPAGFEAWRDAIVFDFGLAVSGLIQVLDPDIIVLGGGLSNASFLYDMGTAAVREMVLEGGTPIVHNSTGDSGGVLGAALLGCKTTRI